MEDSFNFAEAFLEHTSTRASSLDDAMGVEGLLHRAWATGLGAWPRVDLPADIFARHLAQRLPEGRPLAQQLESLALADLYLACACVHGVPAAIDSLERHYLAKLPMALAYLKQPAAMLDDVCQMVRMHLLLGMSGGRPRLAEYTGRGSLQSWIRVIAARMSLKQAAPAPETPEEDVFAALEALPAPGANAELELIKRRYHREFRQAVREAFDSLSSEQRHLLRLHFIDRLPTTELGTLFRVNQSTVSRWLKGARQEIFEETKRRLQERLDLSSKEFSSLLADLGSQLDLGLSQLLNVFQYPTGEESDR